MACRIWLIWRLTNLVIAFVVKVDFVDGSASCNDEQFGDHGFPEAC